MVLVLYTVPTPEMTPLESSLSREVEALRQENRLLRERVDLLVRKVFGASSEKLDSNQLLLALEGAAAADSAGAQAAAKSLESEPAARPGRRRKGRGGITGELLDSLPAVDVVVEPDEVLTEPEAYRLLGEEVTRQLDYVPPQYICRRIIRRRYARIEAPYQPPVIASLPVMLERCKVGPSLLAVIVTGKFCDHLPLYRQQEIAWSRHRIDISRQDMARWLDLAALWLRPIYQRILGGMWGDGYVQIDETVIKYLVPGTGKARQGYFWTVKRPDGDTVFHWSTERAAAVLEEFVPESFKGVIQCDGYSAYRAYARPRAERIRLAACWAHVRRDFVKASLTGAWRADAGLMVRLIGRLYEIEARLREKGAGPALRAASRASECRAIVLRIGKILENWKARRRHFPSSTMGKACAYALNLWDDLLVYLEDGRIEIDNNEVENSIRPTAVGKKNWLFIGAAEAGERSAILFTVVEACRRYGINPFEYLRDVFTRMPGMRAAEYAKLTPRAWAAERKVTETGKATVQSGSPPLRRCA